MSTDRPRHRLRRQAWVRGTGAAVPSAALVEPATGGGWKPDGGLWTSTWHERHGSAWMRWCLAEDWGARPFDVWLLDPHRLARVYVVDARKHAARLEDAYPAPDGVDWRSVARDWDAVHVTERGLAHARLAQWRCESTAWFRWSFLRAVRVDAGRPT